ncbi:MAG: NAD(P)H-dependent oxidoreductase [Dehalococcoidales bacterium]|nr:NAD(P)H-dependent oxidoreductase [Dehalococcoidales bacterium]
MKVLVVYAHPNPQSFNHAVMESFTNGLKEAGHTYEVLDLYAGGFDPCFKGPDFAQFTGGRMPDDVIKEQQRVSQADAMAFIYPIWWWAPPAILKGWYDRVLSMGFAYGMNEQGQLMGLLKHKKVLHITTTMGDEGSYKALGAEDAIKAVDRAAFSGVCGIQNVEHVFLYSAATSAGARESHLNLVNSLGKNF